MADRISERRLGRGGCGHELFQFLMSMAGPSAGASRWPCPGRQAVKPVPSLLLPHRARRLLRRGLPGRRRMRTRMPAHRSRPRAAVRPQRARRHERRAGARGSSAGACPHVLPADRERDHVGVCLSTLPVSLVLDVQPRRLEKRVPVVLRASFCGSCRAGRGPGRCPDAGHRRQQGAHVRDHRQQGADSRAGRCAGCGIHEHAGCPGPASSASAAAPPPRRLASLLAPSR
jgi:hypothetical protein